MLRKVISTEVTMKRTFIILLTLMTALITQPSFAVNPVLSLDDDGDYVEIVDSESLNAINSQVTMEAWIKATSFPNQWIAIIYKGDERTSNACENRSYVLFLNSSGFFHLASAPSGQAQMYLNSPNGSIALNTWYHVAGIIDAENGVMKILINGTEVATRDFGGDIHISTLPFRIGSSHEEEIPEHASFAGQIDEVRIWNISRTQEDIQMAMHTTLSGKEPGLVGYWRFDEEGGGIAAGLSPYGNDGQLFGDAKFVDSDLQLELVPTDANFIYVPKDYPTIQTAIDAAGEGDVVVVSSGTYQETIRLKSDVMVRGMGAVIKGDADAIVEAVDVTNASLMEFTIDGMDVVKNGILCKGNSDVNISYNVILFTENAIRCFDSSRPKIRNNAFGFNKIGVRLSDSAQPTIDGSKGASNDFFGNAVAIRNETANRIDASYNYWGATNENRITELIKNTGGGSVDFTSFLANVTRTSSKFWTNASALSSAALMFSRLNQPDRALACSERAVELLERAVESDSFSIEYRRALGKIYLEFANIFAKKTAKTDFSESKALEQFEWVLFSEPLDLESWNGVYQIALSDVDKKDFSAFASRLRKVFWEGTPQRKFLDGAEALRNANGGVKLNAIKTAPNSAWLVLGPFEIPDRRLELFNFIQSGGDATLLHQSGAESSIIRVDPNTTFPADGKQLKWTKIEEQNANANFDGTAYASTTIISPDERQVLLVCQGSAIKVWLNRQVISERAFPTDMTISVTLRKGRNRVVVKTTGKTANWNLAFGVANTMGAPVRDITFASAYESRGTKDKSRSISVNPALSLDGNGDYAVVQRQIQDDFTIEFWLRTTHAHPDSDQWYGGAGVVDSENAGGEKDFGVAITGTKIAFGTGVPDITIKSTTDVNTGIWFHVVATRRRADGMMVLYVNGVKEAEIRGTTELLDTVPDIYFGKMHGPEIYFNGQLDEIRIWNIARTQEQIQATMNTALIGNEPGLVGYWNFDDSTANDLSLSGNDSTLYGGATIVVESELELAMPSLRIIDTVDGFSAVPVNQKGQFVLATGIGHREVSKPIKTIEIQTPKEFGKPGAKIVGDVMLESTFRMTVPSLASNFTKNITFDQSLKASSRQIGSVLRIQLEEGIMEAGVLKVKFEAAAGPTTAPNVMFSVKLLASDGRVIRESREGLGGIAVISDAPLPVPRDVVTKPVAGENDVEISWKAVDDARVAGYEILATWDAPDEPEVAKQEVMEVKGRDVATEGRRYHKHISAPVDIEVSYAVRAVATSSLKSEPSGSAIARVGRDTTPPEIIAIKARKIVDLETGDSGTKIEWKIKGAQDIARYEIFRARSPVAKEPEPKNMEKVAEVGADVREYIDKVPRAYIYAVEAVDEQGNRARYSMLDEEKRKIDLATPSIEHPVIILGDKNISNGIRMPNAGDGQNEPVTVGGRLCRRSSTGSFSFDVDDEYVYGLPLHDIYVTVEYFDEGTDWFGIGYNEKRKESLITRFVVQKLQGTGKWNRTTFHLPNSHFGNDSDFLCDFDIGTASDSPLALAKVTVSRNYPPQVKDAHAGVPLRTVSYAMIGPLSLTFLEQEIDLNKIYTVDDKPMRWFESFPYAEYEQASQNIDLLGIYGSALEGNFYALTYVESPDDLLVKLDDFLVELSKYNMVNLWINNDKILPQDTIPAHNIAQLKKGTNKILMKIRGLPPDFQIISQPRMTDLKGDAIENIRYMSPYDVLRDGKE